jgi:protein-disulfide isomerase
MILIRFRRFTAWAALAVAIPACAQQTETATAAQERAAPAALDADSTLARAARSRVKGADEAPVTLIEVSDFQCPFCREFALETFPALDSAYVRTGQVRVVFISYPLPNHEASWGASEAALCAGAQDRFWPMHDRLFRSQGEWSQAADPIPLYVRDAAAVGADTAAFRRCLERDGVAPIIISDLLQGTSGGVNGTPTFILQAAGAEGQPQQRMLVGAQDFAAMSQAIDALLPSVVERPRPR